MKNNNLKDCVSTLGNIVFLLILVFLIVSIVIKGVERHRLIRTEKLSGIEKYDTYTKIDRKLAKKILNNGKKSKERFKHKRFEEWPDDIKENYSKGVDYTYTWKTDDYVLEISRTVNKPRTEWRNRVFSTNTTTITTRNFSISDRKGRYLKVSNSYYPIESSVDRYSQMMDPDRGEERKDLYYELVEEILRK